MSYQFSGGFDGSIGLVTERPSLVLAIQAIMNGDQGMANLANAAYRAEQVARPAEVALATSEVSGYVAGVKPRSNELGGRA